MRDNLLLDINPEHYHRYVTMGTSPWNQFLMNRLLTEVSELTADAPAILDVGMGTGHMLLSMALKPEFKHCRLHGLDFDARMVGKACEEAASLGIADQLELVEGDVHALPYDDNSIDIVYGRSIVHHWADPVKGLAEIFRVLAPEGRVVIHEPLADPEARALATFNAERQALGVKDMSIDEKYTIDELEAQLKAAGITGRAEVNRGEGVAALGAEIYIVKSSTSEPSNQRSRFDAVQVQPTIEAWWQLEGHPGTAPVVTDYDAFTRLVPVMTKEGYIEAARSAWARRGKTRFYLGGTSGTSGPTKRILTMIPPRTGRASEANRALVHSFLKRGILAEGDVMANLFGVIHFSLLHHAMCRIAEACHTSIIPVGNLDKGPGAHTQLAFLAEHGTNVLTGTPSSLIQIANAVRDCGIDLPVERVISTGEDLAPTKVALLCRVFPGVQLISLYGMSECGFIAIGCGDNGYLIREEAFFLELDPDQGLLVTSLDPAHQPPILRYATGDIASITSNETDTVLADIRRIGVDFNFMGNIIDFHKVQEVVGRTLAAPKTQVQLVLTVDSDGRDLLNIRVLGETLPEGNTARVRAAIVALPEIGEALDKNAGNVAVKACSPGDAFLSPCMKQCPIVDLRQS